MKSSNDVAMDIATELSVLARYRSNPPPNRELVIGFHWLGLGVPTCKTNKMELLKYLIIVFYYECPLQRTCRVLRPTPERCLWV